MKIPFSVKIFLLFVTFILLCAHPNDGSTIWLISLLIALFISLYEHILIYF